MEVLFASNNVTDWTNNPYTSTLSSRHDSAYVPYGIQAAGDTQCAMRRIHPAPSSGTSVWYHWYQSSGNTLGGSNDGGAAFVADPDGNKLCEIAHQNGAVQIEIYGDTTETGAASSTVAASGQLLEYDLKVDVTASAITAELYEGQVLVSTATAANTVGGKGRPAQFVFNFWDSVGGDLYFSEFLVAKEDTRGARVTRLDPASAGTHTDWNASVGTLADEDPTTAVRTTAANQRQTANLDTYSGGDNISAVVLNLHAAAGTVAPGNIKPSVRSNGSDYDGSATALENATSTIIHCLETDPDDSGAWTAAKVNALEVGFKSEA